MTTVAIWNPNSGSAPDPAELRQALGESVELVETTADDPGPGQTRDAVRRGASTVVACGGDGTVRACIEPLLGTDTALDVVPLGTGNLLAANLAIPSGLDGAADAGARPTKKIDVGKVNGEAFAVMAGSGFDALMIRDADSDKKARFGRLAYVVSACKHLRDALEPTAVEVDGAPWFRGRTSMVLVGNHGIVTGGLEVFPEARPDDGLLDVAVLSANTFKEWASVAWRLVVGKAQRPDLVTRTQGRRIDVVTRRPRPYELDGEDRPAATTLAFEVDPSALTIHHQNHQQKEG